MTAPAPDDDRDAVAPPQRGASMFPGVSGGITNTLYRDELRTEPLRRIWPLAIFPAALLGFLIVVAVLHFAG